MAYTGTQLITGAYYASGIVARELESVNGSQAADGLILLNEIIEEKAVDATMIPYQSSTTVNMVVGQEEYSVSNLIHASTATFVKDDVRYKLIEQPRDKYLGSYRVNTIQSLPFSFHQEREFGGTKIFLYFLPDDTHVMTIYGIFRLSTVTAGQDLSLTLDQFYISYLKYALAERLCAEYAIEPPMTLVRQLRKYESWINKRSRQFDLSIKKQSTLQVKNNLSWAYINLGKGYVP